MKTVHPIYHHGFTLVELMITIAIASLLFGIAIPNFKSTIVSNRLTASANELIAALSLARSEAIKRNLSVSVRKADKSSCPDVTNKSNTANWENGWDVFTDLNNNGSCDNGETLIRTYPALSSSYTLRSNNFSSFIRFSASGLSNGNGSFVICDDSDANATPEANTAKLIIISPVGRVRMGPDTNNDGIPNTDGVTSVASNITSCTPPFN